MGRFIEYDYEKEDIDQDRSNLYDDGYNSAEGGDDYDHADHYF